MEPVRKLIPGLAVPAPGPKLKLWYPGQDEAPPPPLGGSTGLSPQMTLLEFFERYYLPVVLQQDGDSAKATVDLYRQVLDRWSAITGNPRLSEIDDLLVADYVGKLRVSTFRRGKLGKDWPFSVDTVNKHLRTIRSLLYRIGPQTDPKRKAKQLVTEVPHIRIRKSRSKVKAPFTLKYALQIVAAADEIKRPELTDITPRQFWRCLIAALFYTALRIGTVMGLRWKHLVKDEEGIYWFDVPAELVTKTEKPIKVRLHPLLVEILHAIRGSKADEDLIFYWPHCRRHLATVHKRLQKIAGIPAEKQLSLHAWRRTNSVEMARLGYTAAMEIAKTSLDHADVSTTANHYCEIANELRCKLPALWISRPKGEDPKQQHLF